MIIEGLDLHWLGHASFKIKANKVIYIDPYDIKDQEKADIILITHEHYDHCSLKDIDKIIKDGTILVATADCVSKLNRYENNELKIMQPGSNLALNGINIKAIPAYNTNKRFHPKENNWVGYLITVNNKKVYHAGDTDLIPEMNNLKPDIALLPIGGTYTMNPKESAEACKIIKPKVVIPMHYGKIIGKEQDANNFKELAGKICKVVIFEKE